MIRKFFHTLAMRWFRILQFFLPEAPAKEHDRLRRDLIMIGVAVVLGVLTIGPACFRFGIEGMTSPSGVTLSCASLAFLAVPWLFRATGSRTMSSAVMLTVSLATLWLLVLFEGGLDSEALVWFPFIAIASGFWAERDVVAFAVVLAILSLFGLYIAQSHGLVPPNHTSPAQHYVLATVSTVVAIMFSALLTWLYESNRRKAEEALASGHETLETMLSSLPDLLLELNAVGRIVKLHVPANNELWSIVGDLAPTHIGDLVNPASLPDLLGRIQGAIGSRKTSISKTMMVIEGRQLTCELRLVPFQQKEAIAIIRDITEAERLVQVKDEFVGAVRTELQAPVSAIRRISGILAGGTIATQPDEATQLVDTLDRNAEMLMVMLDDLLRFDHLQSGLLSIRRAPFQLKSFLEEAVRLSHSTIQQYGNQVELVTDDLDESARIRTDRMRMLHLFSRLLSIFNEQIPPNSELSVKVRRDVSEFAISLECNCAADDLVVEFREWLAHYLGDGLSTPLHGGGKVALWMMATIAEELGVTLRFYEELGEGCGFLLQVDVYEAPAH